MGILSFKQVWYSEKRMLGYEVHQGANFDLTQQDFLGIQRAIFNG